MLLVYVVGVFYFFKVWFNVLRFAFVFVISGSVLCFVALNDVTLSCISFESVNSARELVEKSPRCVPIVSTRFVRVVRVLVVVVLVMLIVFVLYGWF